MSLDSAIYDRQEKIQDLHVPKTATVVGCGGTGFWTALFCAMSGVERLILVDSDTIELSNLNRLLFTREDIGKPKVQALAELIRKHRSSCFIEAHRVKLETAEQLQVMRGAVFCCTDNLKSQQLICAFCRANSLKYTRIGYDGTMLNVCQSMPMTFEGMEGQDGYTVTPSWCVPAVLAASAGVASAFYKEIVLMDDISTLHTMGLSAIPKVTRDKLMVQLEREVTEKVASQASRGRRKPESRK